MPLCCFEALWGKFIEKFSFWHQKDYRRNGIDIFRKFVFLKGLKGPNPEENLIMYKQQFLIKPLGQILTKSVFLHKVSHILLNYAFLLFWSIFGEIHRELFFLELKVTIAETSTEIFKKFVFLPCLRGANPEENLDLFKQMFLITAVKWEKKKKKKNFHKVCQILLNYAFLLFWSIFGEIHREHFY